VVEDPAQAETKASAPEVRERDQVEVGLLEEEGEARHPDPAEEPTSEEPQALASEQDPSTGHSVDQEKPTSKLETGSEMPVEALEPDQQDHRNLESQTRASVRQGSAWGRLFQSPDAARWIVRVQASIGMGNSFATAHSESCSSEHHSRLEKALRAEE